MTISKLWLQYVWWRVQGDRVVEFTTARDVKYTLTLAHTFQGRYWTGKREGAVNGYLGQAENRSGAVTHGAYRTVDEVLAELSPWLDEECAHVLEVELLKGELGSILTTMEDWTVEAALEGLYPGKGLDLRYFTPDPAQVKRFEQDLAAYYQAQSVS